MASVAVKSEEEANVEVNVEEKILELLKESPQGISDKVNIFYNLKMLECFIWIEGFDPQHAVGGSQSESSDYQQTAGGGENWSV